jgi:hypothetical protein
VYFALNSALWSSLSARFCSFALHSSLPITGDRGTTALARLTVLVVALVSGSGERGRFVEPETALPKVLSGDTITGVVSERVREVRGCRRLTVAIMNDGEMLETP